MSAEPPGVPARTTTSVVPSRPLLAAARARPVITALASGVAVLLLLVLGAGVGRALGNRDEGTEPLGRWQPAPSLAGPATPDPTRRGAAEDPEAIAMAATGDIIFGDAGAGALPANDGNGFFAGVTDALAADLTMGNLEQPLTVDTGYKKCKKGAEACHAFRAPPQYAAHLREGGFQLLNVANNHGNDYGPDGRVNTTAALAQHDLEYTGERDQITVVDVAGVAVAVLGFSPYEWTNSLVDLDQASGVVAQAAQQADLVVVQVHMGAEGSDADRVTEGAEIFFGENRGDPKAFARTVIDAGADLVIGHGPHVLRGLEFYEGRLIAYSLGNFAGGGGTLSSPGNLGLGAVLKVRLRGDGEFAGGTFVSTHMYGAGLPAVDPEQRSLALVRNLTERDFPGTGAQLGPDGTIKPRLG